MMRVLLVHNYYQQRGGEDQCFEDEIRVLTNHGIEVDCFSVHNDSIHERSKLSVALGTVWSRDSAVKIRDKIEAFQPDVMHAMNTFPLLSPSILRAAKKKQVAVVQEVANYRFACAGAFLFRDGAVCEQCLHSWMPLAAIRHRCYRNSLAGSVTLATSIFLHRMLQTWNRNVDVFLTPSETTRGKMMEFGIESSKIVIKPNALDLDPGFNAIHEDYLVFVGRLSPEKGLAVLLKAWRLNPHFPKLKIIGDGPDSHLVQSAAANDPRIEWLGKRPLVELLNTVGNASYLVMPSVWHEAFGRTTIEAFAKGTPVIGSRIGGTAEIITHGVNGFLCEPNDPKSLGDTVSHAISLSSQDLGNMRLSARNCFEEKYTAKANLQGLLAAYQTAISHAKK
ncbi:MAG: glycosyltransferase family 4 protein [Pirellula sp.]|nr:glycosyltransferase family 4 protein [Pirellula sp.]